MAEKHRSMGKRIFVAGMLLTSLHLCGCSGLQARKTFEEANALSSQGNYNASLDKYGEIIGKHPETGDRVLFEMGTIYAHPKNGEKDYGKALDCFEKLVKNYPASGYRQDSEMMIFYINNVAVKDRTIAALQAHIETLRHEAEDKDSEITTLHTTIRELEQKVFELTTQKATQKGSAVDRILIEKKERRLKLLSKDEVLKSYKIALGGNPKGPKERQGDNKTPEGTYRIDGRNKGSQYHLALHISYPNEKDRKRAKELGVSPGGDIMIHGIKNGFAWVGDAHTEVDWTKGCIAVTDEEIEEIAKVVPNGTIVEIRP